MLRQQWLAAPPGSSAAAADAALRRRHTLQRLPIFESAASAAAEAHAASSVAAGPPQAADATGAADPPVVAAEPGVLPQKPDAGSRKQVPVFMDLLGERFAAPVGIPAAALPDCFVAVGGEAEPAAFALLGVHRPSHAQVYR